MTSQKVAVVTGANKGIGFAIAKGLCENFEGIVYVTARDVARGQEAVTNLKALGLSCSFHQLDIIDQDSIHTFKDYLKRTHGGLDLLVNNAGITFYVDSPEPFGQQADKTIAVNYFGTLNVCLALSPILRQNAQIVNISSRAGHLCRIPSVELRDQFRNPGLSVPQLNNLMRQFVRDAFDDQSRCKGEWGISTYAVSKVGINALTRILQKEFDAEREYYRNISVNSVHPGFVHTDMTSRMKPPDNSTVLTVEEGARAPLFLAMETHNLKGQHVWSDCTIVSWDDLNYF